MFQNLTTKVKLMFLPMIFIMIVIVSGVVFNYFNTISHQNERNAIQTEIFIQKVLKGRISVYQYLRTPNERTAKKVRDDFNKLNNYVLKLRPNLSIRSNKNLCDKIITLSKYSTCFIKVAFF